MNEWKFSIKIIIQNLSTLENECIYVFSLALALDCRQDCIGKTAFTTTTTTTSALYISKPPIGLFKQLSWQLARQELLERRKKFALRWCSKKKEVSYCLDNKTFKISFSFSLKRNTNWKVKPQKRQIRHLKCSTWPFKSSYQSLSSVSSIQFT